MMRVVAPLVRGESTGFATTSFVLSDPAGVPGNSYAFELIERPEGVK